MANTEYLMGLMHDTNLDYEDEKPDDQPTLKEMVDKAVGMLMKDENGFVLYVEGGRIDAAHHDNQAVRALNEVMYLDEAVEHAVNLMGDKMEETLLIVTADHAHPFTFAGNFINPF